MIFKAYFKKLSGSEDSTSVNPKLSNVVDSLIIVLIPDLKSETIMK